MFWHANKEMSFTSRNKQGVISKSGFSFRSIDRFHFEYKEGDHITILIAERGVGLTRIFCSNLAWNPPFENEIISDQKKEGIIKNIQEALSFMGIYAMVQHE